MAIPGDIPLTQPHAPDTMEPIIRWAWNGYSQYSVADAMRDINRAIRDGRPQTRAELLGRLEGIISEYGGGQASMYPGCPVSMTLWVLAMTHPNAENCDSIQLCADAERMLQEIAGADGIFTADEVIAYYRTHSPVGAVIVERAPEPSATAGVESRGEPPAAPATKTASLTPVTTPVRGSTAPPAGDSDEELPPGHSVSYRNEGDRLVVTVTAPRRGAGERAPADDGTGLLNRFAQQISTGDGARDAIATLQAAGVTLPPDTSWEDIHPQLLVQLMYTNADRFNNPANQGANIANA